MSFDGRTDSLFLIIRYSRLREPFGHFIACTGGCDIQINCYLTKQEQRGARERKILDEMSELAQPRVRVCLVPEVVQEEWRWKDNSE